jgi:hypothetical protein
MFKIVNWENMTFRVNIISHRGFTMLIFPIQNVDNSLCKRDKRW